jgi:hypothetical protein
MRSLAILGRGRAVVDEYFSPRYKLARQPFHQPQLGPKSACHLLGLGAIVQAWL